MRQIKQAELIELFFSTGLFTLLSRGSDGRLFGVRVFKIVILFNFEHNYMFVVRGSSVFVIYLCCHGDTAVS